MERVLYELEELVYAELKKMGKREELSPTEVENAEKAVCLLLKIKELSDYDSRTESEMEYSNKMRRHSYGYRDGMYITPAMGRREHDRSYRYMDDGYSKHSIKDRAIDKLERMIDESNSESEKEAVKKMIVGLEHMELY